MLYEMLLSSATDHPDAVAVESDSIEVHYAQLLASVDEFARQLDSQGVGTRAPLILLLPNGVEFAIAVFAVAKLGGIVVPVNLSFKNTELEYYLKDSGAQTVVTTQPLAERYSDLVQGINPGCRIITTVPVAEQPQAPAIPDRMPVDGEFLYQYSSGSTGTPKRVVRTQKHLVNEANNYTQTVNLTHKDRILTVVPLFHAHGFGNCLLASIRKGAAMYTLESFNRQKVYDAITGKGITVFPGVPFMFSILAESPSIEKTDIPGLRLVFSAGAPLAQKTFESFFEKFNLPLRQLYGSTETGSVAINTGDTDGDLWSSVGRAIDNVEVLVVGDDGLSLGAGQEGEIIIRSPAMTKGYANLEEVNKQAFRDSCFWTGDVGRMDGQGNLFICGRKTLFINVGGNKVDPAQIESIINDHPDVEESVVLGVSGGHSQEIIKAVVVCKRPCDAEQIRDWCRGKVADFKVPRIVEFREEIPRSPLGKILRKYLQNEDKASS